MDDAGRLLQLLRELGGMRRLVDDDVRPPRARWTGGVWRTQLFRPSTVKELTSRLDRRHIPEILDRLGGPFDPRSRRQRQGGQGRAIGEYAPEPIDVLLATNMISVGVDVKRLGLMVVAGQPKTTAEYIQATSRVGRGAPGHCLHRLQLGEAAGPSHYETFEHYHATFYQHVEALSVTPFSPGPSTAGWRRCWCRYPAARHGVQPQRGSRATGH